MQKCKISTVLLTLTVSYKIFKYHENVYTNMCDKTTKSQYVARKNMHIMILIWFEIFYWYYGNQSFYDFFIIILYYPS